MRIVIIMLLLAGCAQAPEDRDGSSTQRTLVIVCGILGQCEIEHADNTHAPTGQAEGAQELEAEIPAEIGL
jgi:hypothetical protein